ncbi:conserved hypothetical protein [Tenacibaculum maritimum]|uniref:hypothetical protein n=1 Tax=Tenacibaculum maritimum TaxID=107401 RepID=UPI0012E6B5B0|nr:hypothetical protein [Tenacibaculum maritimum]CAA0173059.1 conserved hypothetical protein [Tenacibaculum maritimum]
MKYQSISDLLALEAINVKSGLFGGKAFASFTEEQLDAIEEALSKVDGKVSNEQIEQLEQQVQERNARLEALENSVNQSLELNSLEAGASLTESIDALGQKCKEYGEKKSVHTSLTHDGKENNIEEKLQDDYFDKNAEHNKID